MDVSFLTLIRKRSFQYHMFFLCSHILFFSRMNLLVVTHYFLFIVTEKDSLCIPERFFCCHILFFVHCHKKMNYFSIRKDSFAVTYYFLSTVTKRDLSCLLKRSFSCHISSFYPRVTEVSGVHIPKNIQGIFPASWALPGFISTYTGSYYCP